MPNIKFHQNASNNSHIYIHARARARKQFVFSSKMPIKLYQTII